MKLYKINSFIETLTTYEKFAKKNLLNVNNFIFYKYIYKMYVFKKYLQSDVLNFRQIDKVVNRGAPLLKNYHLSLVCRVDVFDVNLTSFCRHFVDAMTSI